MDDDQQYYTVPRAAKRAGRPRQALYAAINSGELPAYRMGERWLRVSWAEVERWIRSKQVVPKNVAEAEYFSRLDSKAAASVS